MVVELRRTLIGSEFWSAYIVADSDEKFQDKIQGLTEVFSALLSWVLAKIVSTNALQRASISSTQIGLETEQGVNNHISPRMLSGIAYHFEM